MRGKWMKNYYWLIGTCIYACKKIKWSYVTTNVVFDRLLKLLEFI